MWETTAARPGLSRQLAAVYASEWPVEVKTMLFAPSGMGTLRTLEEAFELIGGAGSGLVPLAAIDTASVAVVALADELPTLREGFVYRLFLSEVPPRSQLALLDTDPISYVTSLKDELASRASGLRRVLDEIGPAFKTSHLEKSKRPRDYIVRPIRIACQNVIVALGAMSQQSSFDGLSVVAWQTCEVPHVATHEGNRALAALTLCDAFQNGGTMEIRFDKGAVVRGKGDTYRYEGHPEGRVPSSLRRFGRTVGVPLGQEDQAAITPAEARELFLAITPMPGELRRRVDRATQSFGIAPERLCFTLLAQVWREIELDFILATSSRAGSILEGGADWRDRPSRKAESDVARAALMVGMFFRRANGQDNAAAGDEIRVIEDVGAGVAWSVDEDNGTVTLSNLTRDIPWTSGVGDRSIFTVAPRASLTGDELLKLASRIDKPFGVLVPRDAHLPEMPDGVFVLRCPDRLADIDKAIEQKLSTLRMSR